MTADLAVVGDESAALDSLTRDAVVGLLERGKTWLELALVRDAEVTDLAEFKAQAETVRTWTVQKQLGKDAELAATELVRRAERGIGVAIRAGQDAGEIAGKGQRTNAGLPDEKISPAAYFNGGGETADTYAVTDGVTDAEFNAALNLAKDEGNLSRTNVVRKVKGLAPSVKPTKEQRLATIEDMASRGMTSGQIADELGHHEGSIRGWARDADIEIPADKVLGHSRRRIDHNDLAEQTVTGLEGMAITLRLLNYEELDPAQAADWDSSLTASFRALNRFRQKIKELSHE